MGFTFRFDTGIVVECDTRAEYNEFTQVVNDQDGRRPDNSALIDLRGRDFDAVMAALMTVPPHPTNKRAKKTITRARSKAKAENG